MPDSSLVMAMTAAPRSATNGSTTSRRSSSPVTELTMGLPQAAANPALRAGTTEESMQRGISTTSWTMRMASTMTSGSTS